MIGANGSGKSNLISAFYLLGNIFSLRLQSTIGEDPDRLLFDGRQTTQSITLTLKKSHLRYEANLQLRENTLLVADTLRVPGLSSYPPNLQQESTIADFYSDGISGELLDELPHLKSLGIYHFHDTSEKSSIKGSAHIDDNRYLRFDGSNLSAYLFFLKERHAKTFQLIEEHIRLVAPYFDRFDLEPLRRNPDKMKLEWRQRQGDRTISR